MSIIPNSLKQIPLGQGWFRLQFLWQETCGIRPISLLVQPGLHHFKWQGMCYSLAEKSPDSAQQTENIEPTLSKIRAMMAGTVTEMAVKEGERVAEGDLLCILEAMKMRLEVTAPRSATVQAIAVRELETVHLGQLLLQLDGPCTSESLD
jgi:biotin carboxyl carrier protein